MRYSIFFSAFRPSKLNTTYHNKPDSPHVLRDGAGLRGRVKVPVREGVLQLPELPAALAREAVLLLHGVAEQGVAQGGEALERGEKKIERDINKKGILSLFCGVEYSIFDKSMNHDVHSFLPFQKFP